MQLLSYVASFQTLRSEGPSSCGGGTESQSGDFDLKRLWTYLPGFHVRRSMESSTANGNPKQRSPYLFDPRSLAGERAFIRSTAFIDFIHKPIGPRSVAEPAAYVPKRTETICCESRVTERGHAQNTALRLIRRVCNVGPDAGLRPL